MAEMPCESRVQGYVTDIEIAELAKLLKPVAARRYCAHLRRALGFLLYTLTTYKLWKVVDALMLVRKSLYRCQCSPTIIDYVSSIIGRVDRDGIRFEGLKLTCRYGKVCYEDACYPAPAGFCSALKPYRLCNSYWSLLIYGLKPRK